MSINRNLLYVIAGVVGLMLLACGGSVSSELRATRTARVTTRATSPRVAFTPTPDSLTFETVCKVSTSDMTALQVEEHAKSSIGQKVIDWKGYVFDARADRIEIAIEPRGGLWTREIVLYGVSRSVAGTLNVEQSVKFSGKIRKVGMFLGTVCNPLEIDVSDFQTDAD